MCPSKTFTAYRFHGNITTVNYVSMITLKWKSHILTTPIQYKLIKSNCGLMIILLKYEPYKLIYTHKHFTQHCMQLASKGNLFSFNLFCPSQWETVQQSGLFVRDHLLIRALWVCNVITAHPQPVYRIAISVMSKNMCFWCFASPFTLII